MLSDTEFKAAFAAVAQAALAIAETLLFEWLPGGKREGVEFKCGDLSGNAGRSLSVNTSTGVWKDFQSGEGGPDLVALYAAVKGLEPWEACKELGGQLGVQIPRGGRPAGPASPRVQTPAPSPRPNAPEKEGWRAVVPVPANAPPVNFKHQHRTDQDIQRVSEYWIGDEFFGYVVRFRTSEGGKDDLPRTYCMSRVDGACRWHWKGWEEPRPLYLPGRSLPGARTVLLVEGEKCADALHEIVEARGATGVYCVVSWPGGCKVWSKANWPLIAGATVIAWPDCDAKREPLTAAERKETPDKAAQTVIQQSKPLLPADKQPGMAAMLGIGSALRELGCDVKLLPIPAPGRAPDGWDCADAIQVDGWDFDRVVSFLAQAQPLPVAGASAPPPGEPKKRGAKAPPSGEVDETPPGDDRFAEYLAWIAEQMKCKVWEIPVTRKLLIRALRDAPALAPCLGFDELRDGPCTRQPWPWRDAAGAMDDKDDLRFGEFLCDEYHLKAAPRAGLSEAIDTVADAKRFHPIRDWLRSIEHDGKPRLEKYLIHLLGHDVTKLEPRFRRYLELVGKFTIMGLIARVMNPGCKFDYSPVLEGITGMGKSTFIEVLVGKEFFSDTHFDIGSGKDGMEQLEGLWGYELSEMTAFRRADSEQVKAFFSSKEDRFRGAYGKYVKKHPRQCVIFCTTNKRQYLYDLTGNRRFWPFWIGQRINLEWLRKWRAQLFAEALALYEAGEPYFPSPEEEEAYFVPEQEKRLIETAVQGRIYDLLTREGARGGEGKTSAELNQHTTFVTISQLVTALGTDAGKSNAHLESQIRAWLEAHDWEYARETGGQRRRGYRQPAVWPPIEKQPAGATGGDEGGGAGTGVPVEEDGDDAPF